MTPEQAYAKYKNQDKYLTDEQVVTTLIIDLWSAVKSSLDTLDRDAYEYKKARVMPCGHGWEALDLGTSGWVCNDCEYKQLVGENNRLC